MAEKFLLKDHLFNQAKVNQIAGEIQGVYSQFESQNFVKTVVERIPTIGTEAADQLDDRDTKKLFAC